MAQPTEDFTDRATKGSALTHTEMDDNWDRAGATSLHIGMVVPWPGIEADLPTNYFICDGQAISRTTYSRLFAVIGTMYGTGDGSTTFNIPDYRGMFLRGTDTTTTGSASEDPDAASRTDRGDTTTGDVVGTRQADDYKAHSHTYTYPQSGGTGIDASSNPLSNQSANTGTSPTSGGNETRSKNVGVHWIIRAA